MTQRLQVYRCNICGNIVLVLHPGVGTLVCCGQPMQLLTEQTTETGYEKHLPVVEPTPTGTKVRVGSTPHPMTPDHHIQWIELATDDTLLIKFLQPTQPPEAEFPVKAEKLRVRTYCNLHSLWKAST